LQARFPLLFHRNRNLRQLRRRLRPPSQLRRQGRLPAEVRGRTRQVARRTVHPTPRHAAEHPAAAQRGREALLQQTLAGARRERPGVRRRVAAERLQVAPRQTHVAEPQVRRRAEPRTRGAALQELPEREAARVRQAARGQQRVEPRTRRAVPQELPEREAARVRQVARVPQRAGRRMPRVAREPQLVAPLQAGEVALEPPMDEVERRQRGLLVP